MLPCIFQRASSHCINLPKRGEENVITFCILVCKTWATQLGFLIFEVIHWKPSCELNVTRVSIVTSVSTGRKRRSWPRHSTCRKDKEVTDRRNHTFPLVCCFGGRKPGFVVSDVIPDRGPRHSQTGHRDRIESHTCLTVSSSPWPSSLAGSQVVLMFQCVTSILQVKTKQNKSADTEIKVPPGGEPRDIKGSFCFMPGVGQNRALHLSPADRTSSSTHRLPGSFNFIFPQASLNMTERNVSVTADIVICGSTSFCFAGYQHGQF